MSTSTALAAVIIQIDDRDNSIQTGIIMKFRSTSLSIQLAEGGIPQLVQVMRAGKFNYNGEILEITPDIFKQMVVNFNDNVRGIDLAVDYKHDSDDVAAGWFKSLVLKNNDTELWAEINWTPNGQKVLAEKEFRYLSADFTTNYVSNETGKEFGPTLLGAGLTNRPFIKEMEPVVQLSELPKGSIQMDEKDKQIAALQKQVEDLKKQLSSGDSDDQNDSDSTATSDNNAQMSAEMAAMKKKLADYEAAAAKAKQDQQLAEKKASFDKLLHEGKAVEAQREPFMSGDVAKFSELAQPINLGGKGSTQEPPADPAVTNKEEAQKEILKLAQARLSEKKSSDMGSAITAVLNENSELRKKYQG